MKNVAIVSAGVLKGGSAPPTWISACAAICSTTKRIPPAAPICSKRDLLICGFLIRISGLWSNAHRRTVRYEQAAQPHAPEGIEVAHSHCCSLAIQVIGCPIGYLKIREHGGQPGDQLQKSPA